MVDQLTQLSKRFRLFSETECAGSSSLYEFLSLHIAEDDEILELSSHVQKGQPIPNLFFGAVHYLLLTGSKHELRNYYPSIVIKPRPLRDSFPFFKDFCMKYREQIISIVKEKIVQTNEVRRCGYLYPVFTTIYDKVKKPMAFIEIGTSAGFQLLWDKYAYSYYSDKIHGNTTSNVHITSEILGDHAPRFYDKIPPVTHRIGLDLHINDLSDPNDSLWLNALIWPEHKERRELFIQAVASVSTYKDELKFVEGDGVALLPSMVEEIPETSTLCIFHTHVANQMPAELKQMLLNNVEHIAGKRNVFHIYNNIWDGDLYVDSFVNGINQRDVVAETDGHGRWFKWVLQE